MDRHACDARGNTCSDEDLISRPARHLEGRQRVDRQRQRKPASSVTIAERAATDQRPIHIDDRQAGRAPLFRHLFVAARRRIGHRRHHARRQPVVRRHRRLRFRDTARTGPAGGPLSPDRHIWARSVLHRTDETAVTRGAPALLLRRNQACAARLRRNRSLLSPDQTSSSL